MLAHSRASRACLRLVCTPACVCMAQFYKGSQLDGGTVWLQDLGDGWARDPKSSLMWFHSTAKMAVFEAPQLATTAS